jgi:hypothetical protein
MIPAKACSKSLGSLLSPMIAAAFAFSFRLSAFSFNIAFPIKNYRPLVSFL